MASDAGRLLCRPPGFVLALTLGAALSWLLAIPTAALGVLAAIRPAPPQPPSQPTALTIQRICTAGVAGWLSKAAMPFKKA